MKKSLKFQTVSLGSEQFGEPDLNAIKEWIGERHQRGGDIILFHLLNLSGIQKAAGVDELCAGGLFYRDRIIECLRGIDGSVITGEIDFDPDPVLADIAELLGAGFRCRMALPAPHEYGLKDRYFGDAEDAIPALASLYRRLLREMRDAGITGHVVIYEDPLVEVFESLRGRKVFLFNPAHRRPDLEMLFEYQDSVAIAPSGLDLIIDMTGEYKVRNLILLDPSRDAIARALQHWEPEHITLGGYYTGQPGMYWETLVSGSTYTRDVSE
ncbi:MAG TPA: hypothetical protein VMC42_06425 [Methanoregulaceae archaeon]|nr:hypothetical protein [Methanoregulaceae archaeon]